MSILALLEKENKSVITTADDMGYMENLLEGMSGEDDYINVNGHKSLIDMVSEKTFKHQDSVFKLEDVVMISQDDDGDWHLKLK